MVGCAVVEVTSPVAVVQVDGPQSAVVMATDTALSVVTVAEQGPPGPPGSASLNGNGTGSANTVQLTAGASAISLYTAVALVGGTAVTAASGNTACMGTVVGLAVQSGQPNATFSVQTSGEVDFSGWNWSLVDPRVYLGSFGNLTQSPSGGGFIQCLGIAKSPTAVLLNIQPPIAIQ